MENTEELIAFIDEFCADFQGVTHEDISIKLKIFKYLCKGNKKAEILKEISAINTNKLDALQKTIYRIKKKNISKIYEIFSLIPLKSLTFMILDKYPEPTRVGLPFINWDSDNLVCFIVHYFSIPTDSEIYNKIRYETIQRYINDWTRNKKPIHRPLKFSIEMYTNIYFMTILKKKYDLIPTDRPGNKQYNSLYLAFLFKINKGYIDLAAKSEVSISNKGNFIHESSTSIITKLLKKFSPEKAILFAHHNEEYEKICLRNSEDLRKYLKFQWCLFKEFKELIKYESLKKEFETLKIPGIFESHSRPLCSLYILAHTLHHRSQRFSPYHNTHPV